MKKSYATTLRVRIDSDLRTQAEGLARDLGLGIGVIISCYLKEFVRNRSIELSVLPRLEPELEQEILRAIQNYRPDDAKVLENRMDTLMHFGKML